MTRRWWTALAVAMLLSAVILMVTGDSLALAALIVGTYAVVKLMGDER